MSGEEEIWRGLPPFSMQRMVITATIPYNYRWRINQIKLMLNDLKDLYNKHNVKAALELYKTVCEEAEILFTTLKTEIQTKRTEIEGTFK